MDKKVKHVSVFLVGSDAENFEALMNYYSREVSTSVSSLIKSLIRKEYKLKLNDITK